MMHDLIGPYNGILGFAALLEESGRDANEREELIKHLSGAVKKEFALLEKFHSIARAEAYDLAPKMDRFGMKETAQNKMDLLLANANIGGVSLENSIPRGMVVIADKHMVEQVMQNLIHNSIKFTGNGGVVSATARQIGEVVEITVRDNGVGMPPELVASLLNGTNSTSAKGVLGQAGTGLGLKMCAKLVKINGGKLWIKSEIGVGTEVTFTLPSAGPATSPQ